MWLLRQLPYPFEALLTPWRLRARLRRATLYALRSEWASRLPAGGLDEDAARLLRQYDAFEGPDAWRDYPRGTFRDFEKFLEQQLKDNDEITRARMLRLAHEWRTRYVLEELGRAAILITIAVTAVLAAGAVVWAAFKILASLTVIRSVPLLGELLEAKAKNVAAFVAGVASLLGVNRFLRDYCGDVQVSATYEETDEKYKKRESILEASRAMLEHVLTDERCSRLVIIGHSLGTTVALDSLLALGRHSRACDGAGLSLGKIEHFVSMGSPVDKIHYFFESCRGRYHRYNRVSEELRGDIGTTPFAKNRKPHIHWINFWDGADIISGALETPSHRQLTELRVDNVQVASLGFPDPSRSHSAYFQNVDVIRTLFGIIFDRKHSFLTAPLIPNRGYDYEAQMLGSGQALARTRLFQALMVLLPWLTVTALATRLAGATGVESVFWKLLTGVLIILFVGYVLGKPWKCRCADQPDEEPASAAAAAG